MVDKLCKKMCNDVVIAFAKFPLNAMFIIVNAIFICLIQLLSEDSVRSYFNYLSAVPVFLSLFFSSVVHHGIVFFMFVPRFDRRQT